MNFAQKSVVKPAAPMPMGPKQVFVTGHMSSGKKTLKQISLKDLAALPAFREKVRGLFEASRITELKFYSRKIDGWVDLDEFEQLEDGLKVQVEFEHDLPMYVMSPTEKGVPALSTFSVW